MSYDLELQELIDEDAARYGDPRRCETHGYATSSGDGRFDAACPACEAEGERAYYEEQEDARRAAMTQDARDAEDAEDAAQEARRKAEWSAYLASDDLPF